MEAEDFNKKYADFLEEGHYGLAINIAPITKYLDEIFETGLIKIPGFKYSQIKSKYGSCRLYTNLFDIVGVHLSRIIENEIERKITYMMQTHSEYMSLLEKQKITD
jgi:hypothetical protein